MIELYMLSILYKVYTVDLFAQLMCINVVDGNVISAFVKTIHLLGLF